VRAALTRYWLAFADAVGGFIEEAAFRVSLATRVLLGKSPKPVDRRWWNRATETPVLVDIYDWTNERLIFSALVWPPLESARHTASRDHRQRVEDVIDAFAKGAAEKMWSTHWVLSGLAWDNERQVWVTDDGFAYDGARLHDYSREGSL
jgi:hypothetical protein